MALLCIPLFLLHSYYERHGAQQEASFDFLVALLDPDRCRRTRNIFLSMRGASTLHCGSCNELEEIEPDDREVATFHVSMKCART